MGILSENTFKILISIAVHDRACDHRQMNTCGLRLESRKHFIAGQYRQVTTGKLDSLYPVRTFTPSSTTSLSISPNS